MQNPSSPTSDHLATPLSVGDPVSFLREIVEPTVADFMTPGMRGDRRRGCLAALSISCLIEHIVKQRRDLAPKGKASILNYKNGGGGSFHLAVIADVANATKHVDLSQTPRALGMAYDDIRAVDTSSCAVLRCGWPLGQGIELVVGPSAEWRLVDIIQGAMKFIYGLLGVTPLSCLTFDAE